jgi:hypothetical protein
MGIIVGNDWIEEFRRDANAAVSDFRKFEAKISRFAAKYQLLLTEIKEVVKGTPVSLVEGQTALNFVGVDGKPRHIQVPFIQINLMQRSLGIFPQVMDLGGSLTCGVSFGVQRPIKSLPTGMIHFTEAGENADEWAIAFPQPNSSPRFVKLDGPMLGKILHEALLPERTP